MRRVQNTPPDEISEQVAVASQLFEHDRRLVEEAQKRQAATIAAEEMGIPNDYMERAVQELQARRAARARDTLRGRAGLLAILGAALTLGAIQVTHHAAPPPPIIYRFGDTTQAHWEFDYSHSSIASMNIWQGEGHGGVAVVRVQAFTDEPQEERFRADVETDQVPPTLAGYKTVSFRVRGQGLGQLRLFLENGNERWCSPFLTAAGPWHQHHLRLAQFLRQTRTSPASNWQDAPYRAPKSVGKIVFKLGAHANPVTEHGEVQIDDLRFE